MSEDQTPQVKKAPAKKKAAPKSKRAMPARTNGDKGLFKESDIDRELAFDVYYDLGPSRSFRKAADKIKEITEVNVGYTTLCRWAHQGQWYFRCKERDIDRGINIAPALKLLEERGEKVSAATVKGVCGTVLEAIRLGCRVVEVRSIGDLHALAELFKRLDDHAMAMSREGFGQLATELGMTDDKVVLGKFGQIARENGYATTAEANGKDKG